MKIFSTLFDVVLLPVAIVKDVILGPVKLLQNDHSESETRKQVEKIDDDIKDDD